MEKKEILSRMAKITAWTPVSEDRFDLDGQQNNVGVQTALEDMQVEQILLKNRLRRTKDTDSISKLPILRPQQAYGKSKSEARLVNKPGLERKKYKLLGTEIFRLRNHVILPKLQLMSNRVSNRIYISPFDYDSSQKQLPKFPSTRHAIKAILKQI